MNFDPVTTSPFSFDYNNYSPPERRNDSPVSKVMRKFFGCCAAVSGVAFLATGSPVALSCFCISLLLSLSAGSSRASHAYRTVPYFVEERRAPPPVVVVNRQPPPPPPTSVFVSNPPQSFENIFSRHTPDSQSRRRQTPPPRDLPRDPVARESRVVVLPDNFFTPTAEDLSARHAPESQQRREREEVRVPFAPAQVQQPVDLQPVDLHARHQPESTRTDAAPATEEDPFARHSVGK